MTCSTPRPTETEAFFVMPLYVARFLWMCRASPTHILFAQTVYSFASKTDRKPWPSLETIAKRSGLDPRRAWDCSRELKPVLPVGKRLLDRGPNAGKYGNCYDLDALEKLAAEKPEGVKLNRRRRKRDLIRFQNSTVKPGTPKHGHARSRRLEAPSPSRPPHR